MQIVQLLQQFTDSTHIGEMVFCGKLDKPMLSICGRQDLSSIEVKGIFEDVHFVDYRGRPDSRRHQFIKTLIISHDVEFRVKLVSGRRGQNQRLIRNKAELLAQTVNQPFDILGWVV